MQPLVWIAVGILAGAFLSAVLSRFGSLRPSRHVGADPKTAAQEVEATLKKIGKWERAAVDRLIQRGAPRDPAAAFDEQMTFGQRVADRVALFGGSWTCLAALQAPVIMMSQNRQNMKDRVMASHDYEVNLRAEMEIQTLHARFDDLRQRDWAELVVMQQRQIELLECIVRDMAARGGQPG